MRIPTPDPRHSPLSEAQSAQFNAFIATLNPDQLAWTLGYLAGVQRSQSGAADATANDARPPEANVPAPAPSQLTVLFASQTGNAAKVAKQLVAAAGTSGLRVSLVNAADYPRGQLRDERALVIVTSTQGEGDPPDTAVELHRYLFSKRAPRLEGLRYGVLALGDYSYTNFCKAGADFDERLAELGAERVLPRVDCDVEFDEAASDWQQRVLAAFKPILAASVGEGASTSAASDEPDGTTSSVVPAPGTAPAVAAETAPVYDKNHPFAASVLDRIVLNGHGSAKQTVHLELSLTGSGIDYQPGDAIGVIPRNAPAYVDELLAAAHLSGEASVLVDGHERSLREALLDTFEVTTITRPFVKAYAAETKHTELAALLEPGQEESFQKYVHGREIIDVLITYPPGAITAQGLVGMFRRLQPRLYSIASSLLAHEEEAHLLVGLTRYHSYGRLREGVCSGYLCARRGEDEPVRVFPSPNAHFRLPANPDARMIMVGPGTGVAPFRAFVEERAALGCRGRNWLFFGDRHFATDFLYQVEWQRWHRAGVLSRMDLAFSRDEADKVYVQQRMRENARDLFAWLQDGAYLYVCGDAGAMAAAVHQTLVDVVAQQSGKSHDAAVEYVEDLQSKKRYLRDVY